MLAALSGFAIYTEVPAGGPGLRTFLVSFPLSEAAGPEDSGEASDGQTAQTTLTVNQSNITRITFQFQFRDMYRFSFVSPAGATFRVTSPEGVAREASCAPGGTTQASIEFLAVNERPDEATLAAASLKDAQKKASARYPPGLNGTGDWTIEVTATRDYLLPIHGQGGISWSLTTRLESYAANVEERSVS